MILFYFFFFIIKSRTHSALSRSRSHMYLSNVNSIANYAADLARNRNVLCAFLFYMIARACAPTGP